MQLELLADFEIVIRVQRSLEEALLPFQVISGVWHANVKEEGILEGDELVNVKRAGPQLVQVDSFNSFHLLNLGFNEGLVFNELVVLLLRLVEVELVLRIDLVEAEVLQFPKEHVVKDCDVWMVMSRHFGPLADEEEEQAVIGAFLDSDPPDHSLFEVSFIVLVLDSELAQLQVSDRGDEVLAFWVVE